MVERVFPDTLADALGIQVSEILLRLNGESLRGAADVKSALEARHSDDPVRVERIDVLRETCELVWEPRG